MLGIDRRVLQTAWTLFLFLFTFAAIYEIRRTLVLFALALFLANLLSPLVERVHWWIPPSGSRGPAGPAGEETSRTGGRFRPRRRPVS